MLIVSNVATPPTTAPSFRRRRCAAGVGAMEIVIRVGVVRRHERVVDVEHVTRTGG